MEIIIENEQDIIEVNDELNNIIYTAVAKSLEYEGFEIPSEISIVLTDDEGIHELNKQYRNVDKPTDVLSFPILDITKGQIIQDSGDVDRDKDLILLGDIAISLEMVKRQAEEYGHSFNRELAFLTTHGMFHLLGYDHMNETDEKEMLGKQEKVLQLMELVR